MRGGKGNRVKTQLILIRHGQSVGNLHNAFLGHTDLPLTELGHAQAERAAAYLVTAAPDAIYASDLLRAYQTAEHTAHKLGLPIIKSEALREIYAGEWEGLPFDRLAVDFAEDYGVWCSDIGASRPTGGEAVGELYQRIYRELVRIAKENEGGRILVFLHATPIRAISARLLGHGLSGMKDLPWPTNASATELCYENGALSLVNYSYDGYLGDAVTALPNNV